MTTPFQSPLARSAGLVLLIVLALACFWPGVGGPFLHDDIPNIARLKVGALSWDTALDVAVRNDSGVLRRPISNLSLAAHYWAGATSPLGYKLVNLAIHGLCGWLVYLLTMTLVPLLRRGATPSEARFAAAAAMLLWLVHPLQVSTTLYVVQRMAQLSTLFVLLGLLAVARWLASERRDVRSALVTLFLFGAATLVSLLCKESGAVAPLLAGVLLLFAAAPAGARQPGMRWLAWLGVGLPVIVGAAWFASHPDFVVGGYVGREFDLSERLATQATVLWFYLKLFFVPNVAWMGLFHDGYPLQTMGSPMAWAAIAAWAAAVALAVAWRRRQPLFGFAALWFLGAHAVESSFIALEMVYEHRNYLALVGPCIAIGAAVARARERWPALPTMVWLFPLLALAGLTLHRAHLWSSRDVFTVSEFHNHPRSLRAVMGEVGRLAAIGRLPEAKPLARRFQRMAPAAAWPLMLDAAFQCIDPRHPVAWRTIEQRMRAQPDDDRFIQLARYGVSERVRGGCPGLQVAPFNRVLELGYATARSRDDTRRAELYAMFRGWMARQAGEHESAALWLRRSAHANPAGVEALFDLAFLELNAGRLDDSERALHELRARERAHRLPIGYRIDELEGYVAQERAARLPSAPPAADALPSRLP